MSLKQVQEDVDKWTGQFTPQYWAYKILGQMTQELGEISKALSRVYGTIRKKEGETQAELGLELATFFLQWSVWQIVMTLICRMHGMRE